MNLDVVLGILLVILILGATVFLNPFRKKPEPVAARTTPSPLGDQVVIEPIEVPTAIGGLEVPQTQTERPQRGIVRAVGPGKRSDYDGSRIEPEVQVGDCVSFPSYAGGSTLYRLNLGDGIERTCLIVRHEEILFNHGHDPVLS
jgi:co-chaperonin GroES (HSP10)